MAETTILLPAGTVAAQLGREKIHSALAFPVSHFHIFGFILLAIMQENLW